MFSLFLLTSMKNHTSMHLCSQRKGPIIILQLKSVPGSRGAGIIQTVFIHRNSDTIYTCKGDKAQFKDYFTKTKTQLQYHRAPEGQINQLRDH